MEGPLGKVFLLDISQFELEIKEGKEVSIKPKNIDQY